MAIVAALVGTLFMSYSRPLPQQVSSEGIPQLMREAAVEQAEVTKPQDAGAASAEDSEEDGEAVLGPKVEVTSQAEIDAAKAAAEARRKAEAEAKAEAEREAREAAEREAAAEEAARSLDRAIEDPKAAALALMTDYGWGNDQFECLDALWTRESNWDYTAQNPSSGAYGIPQALPASKMATAGNDYLTNPVTQIKWGLGYIGERYGTPCGAWAHSESVGWY